MGMSDVLTADVEVAGGVSVEVVEKEEDVLEDVVDVLDVDEDSEDVEEEVEVEVEMEVEELNERSELGTDKLLTMCIH